MSHTDTGSHMGTKHSFKWWLIRFSESLGICCIGVYNAILQQGLHTFNWHSFVLVFFSWDKFLVCITEDVLEYAV